jgi:serine phosphatase RsbU (regulator of sigma subunit)
MPDHLTIRSGIGRELSPLAIAELRARTASLGLGQAVVPLWVRGRATAVLVAQGSAGGALEHLAQFAGPALEVAASFTDEVERARRHQPASAAAEMQQDLLPPRLARFPGGEIAGSLLPAYSVGGDWFDHALNSEGVWIAIADAVGRGLGAAALSAAALAALRGSRRAGCSLEVACSAMHEAVSGAGGENAFVTAIVGLYYPETRKLRWVNCGHPAPLVVSPNGEWHELSSPATQPLGLFDQGQRSPFRAGEHELERGQRVVFYSDGISERRDGQGGFFGQQGLAGALTFALDEAPSMSVANVERAVRGFGPGGLADDATHLVLGIH